MNLGGNDFAEAITALGLTVAAVVLLPGLLFHVVSEKYASPLSMIISNVCFGYLAYMNFQKGYGKDLWIKVTASPINEEVSRTFQDASSVLATVGWSFIHEGKQHNIKFGSSDHYVLDREVYWSPDKNEVILSKLKTKFYFFSYSICTTLALYMTHLAIFVELMGFKEVIPANLWLLFFASPIGLTAYLEYKNR